MNKIVVDEQPSVFGALKLIEQLYKDDMISELVFRNIVNEYRDLVPIDDFDFEKKPSQDAE